MKVSRRRFLGGAGAAVGTLAAGAVLAGCDEESTADTAPEPTPKEPFYGTHQMGIIAPTAEYATAIALDVTANDRDGLVGVLTSISANIEALTQHDPPEPAEPLAVPEDAGIVVGVPGTLTSGTLSAGASLFDDRFGLAKLKPDALVPMPDGLARDELDPARTHGDLLLVLQAPNRDTVTNAVRRILRDLTGAATARWMLDVFARPDTTEAPDVTSTRNLMGFKDGTANPDPTLDDLMNDVVWSAGAEDGEPDWCTGGTYLAARTLRMIVEDWDAQTLDHQEKVFGRTKVTGAPLDGEVESDVPLYPKDAAGQKIPLTAHIRLANPRDGEALLMLRRSMSYERGIDANGQLDQGLFFVSYQRSLQAFLEAQARLKGEPLEQFVITHGGGFFFSFPGPAKGEYLGAVLIDAAG
ncbi:MAG: Dyp-type peroxidase [Cumulibacter sp.]